MEHQTTQGGAILSDTFAFQWHITDRCNRRCRHCYQERFDAGRELEIDALIGLADHILSSLAIPVSINITGGEPLLVPGIVRFLSHLGAFRNLEELNIITNGTVVDDDIVRVLRGLPRLSGIKVSLESHDPSINDAVRGRGHLATVIRNLQMLRAVGCPLTLMVTLGRHNVGSIPGLFQLAEELSVSAIIFERYVPLGQGKSFAAMVLSAQQWAEASRLICRLAGLHDLGRDDLLPYKAFRIETAGGGDSHHERVSGALCNLGPSSMALMPDGTVYPCRRLPLPVGRLPHHSMKEIRTRLRRFSPAQLIANMHGERCGSCGIADCAGCRALTVALGGGLHDDDPQCLLGSETKAGRTETAAVSDAPRDYFQRASNCDR